MEDHYKRPVDEKKVKFKLNLLSSRKESRNWSFIITIVSFFLSASMSVISSEILDDARIFVSFCVVFIIVAINIIFDIIGTAVTAADEAPFHAMASRKVYGAKQAIKLIRNADKVSNFSNDVIGDICGVISGTACTYIVLKLVSDSTSLKSALASLVITGMVAALTVGGKSFGKSFAIENSNYIIYKVAIILKFLQVRINVKKKQKYKNGRK